MPPALLLVAGCAPAATRGGHAPGEDEGGGTGGSDAAPRPAAPGTDASARAGAAGGGTAGGSGGAGGTASAADAGGGGGAGRADAGTPDRGGTPETAAADAQAPATARGTFVAEDGILVVEMESLPLATGWAKKTGYAGYTGSGYYEWTAGGISPPGRGTIRLQFQIKIGGNYQLVWRNQEGPGPEDMANDSFVRLLTGTEIVEGNQSPLANNWFKTVALASKGRWQWNTTAEPRNQHDFRPVRRAYAEGTHAIEIAGRSTGHTIDRIVIFRYEAGQPAQITSAQQERFTMLPESPRVP